MENELIHIKKPLVICGKTIKNRIVVPAMADFGMTEKDGQVNQRHIDRYARYAMGGAGLIIIEACAVSKMNEPRNTIGLYCDHCIPSLKKLAEAAKQNGAGALVQIMETGLTTMVENRIDEIQSDSFLKYKADFLSAALRCYQAGFDGVELHAAHGMFLNQIIETSTRVDGYGGSLENRMRFVSELVHEIKAACGENFIIAVRLGNPDLQELTASAQLLEEAGADLLDISTGTRNYTAAPEGFPYDRKIYAASLVKQAVSLPVIAVGNIHSGQQAEQILSSGYADMTAIGRGHLCDPFWANKVFANQSPNPCLHCKRCLWYIDGRKCPAIKGVNKHA